MSTARTARVHYKGDKHGSEEATPNHAFRNTLLVSLVIAAIILWQLNAIIHALSLTQTGLAHLEGLRGTLGGLIRVSYHEVASIIGPLIHDITHS